MWTGEGPREARHAVAFSEAFALRPWCNVGISMWDTGGDTNQRADLRRKRSRKKGSSLSSAPGATAASRASAPTGWRWARSRAGTTGSCIDRGWRDVRPVLDPLSFADMLHGIFTSERRVMTNPPLDAAEIFAQFQTRRAVLRRGGALALAAGLPVALAGCLEVADNAFVETPAGRAILVESGPQLAWQGHCVTWNAGDDTLSVPGREPVRCPRA